MFVSICSVIIYKCHVAKSRTKNKKPKKKKLDCQDKPSLMSGVKTPYKEV